MKQNSYILFIVFIFSVNNNICMEQKANAISSAFSKLTHWCSKQSNQKGYVCDRNNQNKYHDVYSSLEENTVEKMRNNTNFQERTKQSNDRSWHTQDFIKRNLEGIDYPQIGALQEAVKNNYPAMSLVFLEYTLLALKEGRVVNENQLKKFLKAKKDIFDLMKEIWPNMQFNFMEQKDILSNDKKLNNAEKNPENNNQDHKGNKKTKKSKK